MFRTRFSTGDLKVVLEVLLQHLGRDGLLVGSKSVHQDLLDGPNLEDPLHLKKVFAVINQF